jgi:4-oxalocrotonate tautomerase
MPFITITLFEGRTPAQKRALAKEITDVMVRVAKTTPDAVDIVFVDVKKSDWAHGGELYDKGQG